jgi:hypothetical protein
MVDLNSISGFHLYRGDSYLPAGEGAGALDTSSAANIQLLSLEA